MGAIVFHRVKRTIEIVVMLMLVTLTAMAVLLPAGAASVYTPVTPGETTVTHGLQLTQSPYMLGGNVTYSFTVGNVFVAHLDGVDASELIEGSGPKLSDVTYGPTDDFAHAESNTVKKSFTIDWQKTEFKEPGIYYWPITKAVSKDDTVLPEEISNNEKSTYLFVYIYDNNGVLTFGAAGLYQNTEYTGSKVSSITDTYPATPGDLKVSKAVTGNLGSKDQYFKFTIKLTLPSGLAAADYVVSGFDTADVVNASPYNSGAVQPTSPVSLTGGENTIEVWLKDKQTLTIEKLPNPTLYTITETNAAGYEEPQISNNGVSASGTEASGKVTNSVITVSYTNHCQESAPTGVFTDSSAAVAGLLAGAGLILVLALSRRKRRVH